MTDKECIDKYLDFLKAISHQGYSQDFMEMASNMFVVIPKDSLEFAMDKFTELAKKGLTQKGYHYEISRVFKKLMGYT